MKPSTGRTQTGLIQEALLILAGHRSGLLIETEQGDSEVLEPSISSYFHPASIECLSRLVLISNDYNGLDRFSRTIINRSSHSPQPLTYGNQPRPHHIEATDHLDATPASQSISALASSLSIELDRYRNLLVEIEFKLLSHHPSFVPIDSNQSPSPPLTAILAELTSWSSVFKPLHDLIDHLKPDSHQPVSELGLDDNPRIDRWNSSNLIELIYQHSLTGSPHLAEILDRLQYAVERVWINSFRSFVIYGQPPNFKSNGQTKELDQVNCLSDDLFFAQPNHPNELHQPIQSISHQPVNFYFRKNALPNLPSLQPIDKLADSIHQIAHALSILNHLIHPTAHSHHDSHKNSRSKNSSSPTKPQKIDLPLDLQSQLRLAFSSIDRLCHPQFRTAIQNIQEILSNYLFSNYLTPQILSNTIQSLSDVFLLRHSTFATNLVEGLIRLRANRLGLIMSDEQAQSNRTHRSGAVRRSIGLSNRELDLILLKAGISTELGDGPIGRKIDLEGFAFTLLSTNTTQSDDEQEPSNRTDPKDVNDDEDQRLIDNRSLIDRTFAHLILNVTHPVLLIYSPRPGLSLFLNTQVCQTYSKINSCLISFLITKQRLKDAWRELNRKEQLNTRLNPYSRPSDDDNSSDQRSIQIQEFKRLAFENLRRMNWFIDLMVNYFFQDVIDQSIGLLFKQLDQHYYDLNCKLNPDGRPNHETGDRRPSGSNLGFFKIHQTFLTLIETGLGLKNPIGQSLMKQTLKSCLEFLTEIENWSFELIPNLLSALNQPHHKIEDESCTDDEDKIIKTVRERRSRLMKSIGHFHQLVNRLIDELRKDDLQSSHSITSDLGHHHQFQDHHHRSLEESDSTFFLQASIFRRKCLDSLLLQPNIIIIFITHPRSP